MTSREKLTKRRKKIFFGVVREERLFGWERDTSREKRKSNFIEIEL